nr:hypothetical protein [Tanacetum cinerariifolium]
MVSVKCVSLSVMVVDFHSLVGLACVIREVAILAKSNASEGFDQIIDFLNGSYIQYALIVNPHIYVSCIKQFWNTVTIKQSADVTRLQALVDRKKVVISEAVIRDVLRLDVAEGVDCLPNEEIFTGLARMGYEKPSTKLAFYKAFFSSRKFNFSKYIFDSLVRNIDNSSKFYMYPRFIQLIIQNQIDDLSIHTTKYFSPALTQKVFANMRKIGKGFSGVETPLFEGMLVVRENVEADIKEKQVPDDIVVAAAQEVVTTAAPEDILAAVLEDVNDESIPSPALPTPPPQSSHDIPSTLQAQSPSQQPQSPTPT